jgi:hypothetical protein
MGVKRKECLIISSKHQHGHRPWHVLMQMSRWSTVLHSSDELEPVRLRTKLRNTEKPRKFRKEHQRRLKNTEDDHRYSKLIYVIADA